MKIQFAIMRIANDILGIRYENIKEKGRFDTYEEAEKEIEKRLEKKEVYSREYFIQKIFVSE